MKTGALFCYHYSDVIINYFTDFPFKLFYLDVFSLKQKSTSGLILNTTKFSLYFHQSPVIIV